MKSQALALSIILLLGTTLSEVRARPTEDKDLMKELGTWAIVVVSYLQNFSIKAGKVLNELSEIKPIADVRKYVTDAKDALSEFIEQLEKELDGEIKKLEKEEKKAKRKNEEKSTPKETPQQAQEN